MPTIDEAIKTTFRWYPVRVSEGVFEALADRVEWGEPDADGFYTPALYREPQIANAVRKLGEAAYRYRGGGHDQHCPMLDGLTPLRSPVCLCGWSDFKAAFDELAGLRG